jgi:CBS domain-containing protein
MDTVGRILENKGTVVHCVLPETFVFDALELMARHEIGALVVRNAELPLGLFGEREYARKVILAGRSSRIVRVAEVMTTDVPTVGLHEALDRCMETMTRRRVRYLPVVDDGRMHGIISIGDVVHALLAERDFEIDQLHHYIAGVP